MRTADRRELRPGPVRSAGGRDGPPDRLFESPVRPPRRDPALRVFPGPEPPPESLARWGASNGPPKPPALRAPAEPWRFASVQFLTRHTPSRRSAAPSPAAAIDNAGP